MKNKIHKLALFGNPVEHSRSPEIHAEFAKQFDLQIDYQLIEVSTEYLALKLDSFFAEGGLGANVTVPHKKLTMEYLDIIHPLAEAAGAVNTIIYKNGQLIGENTDGIGFVADIQNKHHFHFTNKKILIIGAGGATQGIIPAMLKHRPGCIHIANRSIEKAQQLRQRFPLCQAIEDESLQNSPISYDLIIHSTSLGHQGLSPKLFSNTINKETIAYDLSYAEAAEPFLSHCQEMGIQKAYDGLGMLKAQAAQAFKLWFGHLPDY